MKRFIKKENGKRMNQDDLYVRLIVGLCSLENHSMKIKEESRPPEVIIETNVKLKEQDFSTHNDNDHQFHR